MSYSPAINKIKHLFLSRYTAVGYPDYVQYTALVDEIESIFTLKGMKSIYFLLLFPCYFDLLDGGTTLEKPERVIP